MNKFFSVLIFMLISLSLQAFELNVRPNPGDELVLSEGELKLYAVNANERINFLFKNLTKIVETFKPDLGPRGEIKTFETDLTTSGQPRFLLVAKMKIDVPIIKSLKVTRSIRATAHVESLNCQDGKRIILDLADSDRDILLQAEFVYLDLCVVKKTSNSVVISYKATMVVGDDFGMRIAGKLAMDLLSRQIPPLLDEFAMYFNQTTGRIPASHGPQCEQKNLNTRRLCINRRGEKQEIDFYNSLPSSDQKILKYYIKRGAHKNNHFLQIQESKNAQAPIVLLIQGFLYEKAYEWYRPFHALSKTDMGVYLYRYKTSLGTQKMVKKVELMIKELMLLYPNQKIEVIGFSAGGLLSLIAMDSLQSQVDFDFKRVRLTTVASPIGGYGVPGLVAWASGIFEMSSFIHDVMTGYDNQIQNISIKNCSHYITTNCFLDVHACAPNPEYGSPQVLDKMPCGQSNTFYFDNLSHHQVLEQAIVDLIKGYN